MCAIVSIQNFVCALTECIHHLISSIVEDFGKGRADDACTEQGSNATELKPQKQFDLASFVIAEFCKDPVTRQLLEGTGDELQVDFFVRCEHVSSGKGLIQPTRLKRDSGDDFAGVRLDNFNGGAPR